MSKLPRISGRECIKALGKVGFYVKRQESSHIILRLLSNKILTGNLFANSSTVAILYF